MADTSWNKWLRDQFRKMSGTRPSDAEPRGLRDTLGGPGTPIVTGEEPEPSKVNPGGGVGPYEAYQKSEGKHEGPADKGFERFYKEPEK